MTDLEVETQKITDFLEPELIHSINSTITEGEPRYLDIEKDSNVDSAGLGLIDFTDDKEENGVQISREEDHHVLLNGGVIEGLQLNINYEFGEKADILDITSYVMETIAKNQAYGDGNKRTAYVVGTLLIIVYQIIEKQSREIVTPSLTEDFVQLISEVAVDEKSKEDIREYLKPLEDKIKENN